MSSVNPKPVTEQTYKTLSIVLGIFSGFIAVLYLILGGLAPAYNTTKMTKFQVAFIMGVITLAALLYGFL